VDEEKKFNISETAANVVENIAFRVAERQGGKITVNDLASYLPMSLDLIRSCLNNMVDGHSVVTGESNGFSTYEFTACTEKHNDEGMLNVVTCVSCNEDLLENNGYQLCKRCLQAIEKELNRLAEVTGWPAQAVYEHEILYLAAKHNGPHHASELAGHSRYTLKRMQQKLKTMTLEGYLRQELDEVGATIVYYLPMITYPKKMFNKNMALIRSYPASVMEDMEIKIIRIILILASMLVAVFFLALLRIPLPALIIGFVIIAPIVAFKIWRHREKPSED